MFAGGIKNKHRCLTNKVLQGVRVMVFYATFNNISYIVAEVLKALVNKSIIPPANIV
jgi:hypothetical protein